MRKVAVLRPEPGAGATLARARAMGLDAFALPLFAVEPLTWEVPDPQEFDALLLTSANSVRQACAGLHALQTLPVHAVGTATAETARAAGLVVATVGSRGVEDLLASLPHGLRLLHLSGEHRRAPSCPRQQLTSVPVYRSAALPDPAGVQQLVGAVALIHSPRAGRRLAELLPQRSRTALAAISAAAADACGSGWERVAVAERPDDEAVLSLAATLCEHLPAK